MLDNDVTTMSIPELQDEVMKLRNGIRTHRDQKGDENCWLDDQMYLYGLLPESKGAEPELPDKRLMMVNCSRYYDCRKTGKAYHPLKELEPWMVYQIPVNKMEQEILIAMLKLALWPNAEEPEWRPNTVEREMVVNLLTKLGWRPSGGLAPDDKLR